MDYGLRTKRILSLCMILLFLGASSVFAEMRHEADPLEAIWAEERLPLGKVLELLSGEAGQTPQGTALRQTCEALSMREGLFVQEGRSSKGKVYTATVSFYLQKGVPYCSVEYTNFGGTLSDAPVEYTEDGAYTTYPVGEFYGRELLFTILLGEEHVRIQWGDTNDYTLMRSTGNVSEYTDDPIPFEERELYRMMVSLIDGMLGDVKHQCTFVEEEKTFYTYVTMGEELRTILLMDGDCYRETWSTILEGFIEVTERGAAAITLDIRESIGDVTKAHCTVMFVDSLNDRGQYAAEDAIAIIKDGSIMYDLLRDGAQKDRSLYSAGYSPTTGERNALRSARAYLNVSAFSKSGLMDQLMYEGFSQHEAEYAAENCGADWYAQAAESARAYLRLMAFSRSSLIDQLEYEGFTYEQAVYGVTQNGY